jgi:hypothetical protein
MGKIQLETCIHYLERGFAIDLKDKIYYCCFLQDTNACKEPVIPFLITADNIIDPGPVPLDLLELIQVEEIVITCTYIQILIKQVRGY